MSYVFCSVRSDWRYNGVKIKFDYWLNVVWTSPVGMTFFTDNAISSFMTDHLGNISTFLKNVVNTTCHSEARVKDIPW